MKLCSLARKLVVSSLEERENGLNISVSLHSDLVVLVNDHSLHQRIEEGLLLRSELDSLRVIDR